MPTLISHDQLVELVESIWNSMLGLTVVPECGEGGRTEGERLVACVEIAGAWNGSVQLATTERLARRAAAQLLAAPAASIETLDVQDATAELCNILGGSIKCLLPRPSLLALPTVTQEPHGDFGLPPAEVTTELRFTCEGELLEVRVVEHIVQ